MDRFHCGFEVKFAPGVADGTFSGYGAVCGNVDLGGDVLDRGCFSDTLRAWQAKGKWPKMLNQHGGGLFGGSAEDMIPIGQWTDMAEDDTGLRCQGKLFALDTDKGRYLYEGIKSGELDGLSIGYRTRREDVVYGEKDDEPSRTIKKLDLFEVSLVTFGMNPAALIDQVKAEDVDTITTLSEAERFLREAGRFDRKTATAFVSRLKRLSQREAAGELELRQLARRIRALTA